MYITYQMSHIFKMIVMYYSIVLFYLFNCSVVMYILKTIPEMCITVIPLFRGPSYQGTPLFRGPSYQGTPLFREHFLVSHFAIPMCGDTFAVALSCPLVRDFTVLSLSNRLYRGPTSNCSKTRLKINNLIKIIAFKP